MRVRSVTLAIRRLVHICVIINQYLLRGDDEPNRLFLHLHPPFSHWVNPSLPTVNPTGQISFPTLLFCLPAYRDQTPLSTFSITSIRVRYAGEGERNE